MERVQIGGAPRTAEEEAAQDTAVVPDGAQTTRTGKTTAVAVPSEEHGSSQDTPSARPDWLPDKFKDIESFVRSYGELEKKLGGRAAAAEPAPPDAAAVAEAAGVDVAGLTKEYVENNGALTDATLATLKAKGITQDVVDSYIAGQRARADAYTAKLAETVGGQPALDALLSWASTNLSAPEIAAFNSAVTSFDEASAGLALAGLRARHDAAMGTSPNLIRGAEAARPAGIKPFGSNAELVRAMQDRRYEEGDRAYHAEIEQRLAVTDMFRLRY